MKTMYIMGAVLVVGLALTGYGALKVMDHRYANSAEAIDAANVLATATRKSDALDERFQALAKDGCASRANDLTKLNASKRIERASDIPESLRGDLALCIQRGIMLNFVAGSLKDAGLWAILAPSVS